MCEHLDFRRTSTEICIFVYKVPQLVLGLVSVQKICDDEEKNEAHYRRYNYMGLWREEGAT